MDDTVFWGMMTAALILSARRGGKCARKGAFLSLSRLVVPSLSLSTASLRPSLTSLLKDPSLLPHIEGGKSVLFDVNDPSNNAVIAQIPVMGKSDAERAIQKSHDTLPDWRDGTTAAARGNLLLKWSNLMQENADDLAVLMTLESGKPLAESRGEVSYARSFLDYYSGEAIRSSGAGGGVILPTPFASPSGSPRGQVMATQQAIGVAALITPWNFPSAMITRKVGPALAAGCTAVVKPSELTPLSAIALQTLAERAGIPPNVFQVV